MILVVFPFFLLGSYFLSSEITKKNVNSLILWSFCVILEKRASKLQVKFQTVGGSESMKLKMSNLKGLVVLSCHSQGNCEKKIRKPLNYCLLYFERLSQLTYLIWRLLLNSVSLTNSTCMQSAEGLYTLTWDSCF